ncbi:MAG: HEAT repeat domain-containing protein, partial [Rhodospirillales bacterium]|nr:HEAT repeat domain-containing protein [Rhodospirillales bacterium]
LCVAALSDASLVVRHEAAEALGAFRGEKVEATLLQLLASEIVDIHLTACISLARHRRRDAATP